MQAYGLDTSYYKSIKNQLTNQPIHQYTTLPQTDSEA